MCNVFVVRVVMIALHLVDSKMPYYVVRSLLIEILDLDMEKPHQEREHYLFSILHDDFVIQHLPLLNDMLHLKVSEGLTRGISSA